jgi:hypothetical protein
LTEVQKEETVDEISYRRGQRYLTSVVDHQTRRDRVVLAGPQHRDVASIALLDATASYAIGYT